MIDEIKEAILLEVLKEIPFAGFSDAALRAAAASAGIEISEMRKHFPRGGESLVEAFSEWADMQMLACMTQATDLKIRERISYGVRSRIEAITPYKESARRAAAFLALPQNAPLATRLLFATVDGIWRAAGDRTSDFNYYTKRGLLAGVYGSTLLYWLSDSSEGHADTWTFLDARIGDVMKLQQARGSMERGLAQFPNPLSIFESLRSRRAP